MSKILQQLFSKSKTLVFIFSFFLGGQIWSRIKQINYSINSSNFNIFSISRRNCFAISILMLLVFGSVGRSYGQVANIGLDWAPSTIPGFTNYYKKCFTATSSSSTSIPSSLNVLVVTANSSGTNTSTTHTINWGDGSPLFNYVGTNPFLCF